MKRALDVSQGVVDAKDFTDHPAHRGGGQVVNGTAPDDIRHRAGSLLDRYQVPPFSVLDTRQGYWQEARRSWLALGIRSELGRGFGDNPEMNRGGALGGGPFSITQTMRGPLDEARLEALPLSPLLAEQHAKKAAVAGKRQAIGPGATSWVEPIERVTRRRQDAVSNVNGTAKLPDYATFGTASVAPGTSIFDPVLCELAYRWWCPPGGVILDPFAGGSVRGLVAAWLGHQYRGVDLSAAQIASNREQAAAILEQSHPAPDWIVGDSRVIVPRLGQEWADFVFTCPPYYDLEVYSDDPADLSAMADWPAFLSAYGDIIGHSLAALKRDRFAAIVVSEIRGRDGIFRGLVPWTIRQFEMHGARYYNEAILINPAGTLPMRVGRQFDAGRKLGRSHQNVLVFVKGDVPRTHEWGYEGTSAPDPQLELFDIPSMGADGRPA